MKVFVVLALAISSGMAMPENARQRRDHLGSAADPGLGINYGAPPSQPLSGYGVGGGNDAAFAGDAAGFADAGGLDAQASDLSETSADAPSDPISMLKDSVPGVPGDDYPIYAEAPETAFTCDDKVNGGYYADSEARCQVFHICAADGLGGLAKYSFLCPNGTIFNQNLFNCDWWFNVDCSAADALAASRNAELEAARSEAEARIASEGNLLGSASASAPISSYGGADASADSAVASSALDFAEAPVGSYGVAAEAQESALVQDAVLPAAAAYGAPSSFDSDVAASAPVGAYGAPLEAAASSRVFEDSLPSYGRRR